MSARKKPAASKKSTNSNSNPKEATAMSTSQSTIVASNTATSSNSTPEGTSTMNTQPIETTAPAVTSSTGKKPVSSLGTGLLPLPPNVVTPSPPQGYEPTKGSNFRGVVPWTAELAVLPKVVQDLVRFTTSYPTVLGTSAPPVAQVIEAYTVGGQWSTTRAQSAAWDAYCRDQEGSAWRFIKGITDRLRPAFALAVKADATIESTYPSLAEFLTVKKASAVKGATARKKNQKAKADGLPANHGAAGKARAKKAGKAALAATTAEGTAASAPQQASVPPAPVTQGGSATASKPAQP